MTNAESNNEKTTEEVCTKPRPLGTVSIVVGDEPVRFSTDVAFRLETVPLKSEAHEAEAYDARTARVLTLGYYQPMKDRYVISYDKDEKAVLAQFWDIYLWLNGMGARLVGFNVFGFSLPFLIKRSWFHGVLVPKRIMASGGRHWQETFFDLMHAWKGIPFEDGISLDAMAQFLEVGEQFKTDHEFWKDWQFDQGSALECFLNDIHITHRCAEKMGVMSGCP